MPKKLTILVENGIRRGVEYCCGAKEKDEDKVNALAVWIINLLENSESHPEWFEQEQEDATNTTQS